MSHPAEAVVWRDLLPLSRNERVAELLLSLPWLALSLGLAHAGLFVPAFGASFLFFLTGLRQIHGAFHRSLGLPRIGDDLVQLAGSVLMLGSIHAIGVNHLHHHRICLDDGDEEARPARLPWWRAVLSGPRFLWRCHRSGWSLARPAARAWIGAELALNAVWVALVLGVLDVAALRYHVAAMAVGNSLTAFFCVWTVHRGCFDAAPAARTLRGAWKNLLSANMFLHDEHHRFPAVPTRRLAVLGARLDQAGQGQSARLVDSGAAHRLASFYRNVRLGRRRCRTRRRPARVRNG